MPFDPAHIVELQRELTDLDWITEPARIERLSQDFSWFSPVLKRELAGKRADIVVRPRTEDEIRRLVGACARRSVPITLRGSGTGNYGQCVPLAGGVLLDLSGYNQFLWVRHGVGRAQAGIRLSEFDRRAQEHGWELRCVPSTYRSATLGGLYGGGFGGVGSINYGPLASTGNVLAARVMSVEPAPHTVELAAPEALLLHHTYGTNGIVLEIETALAPAHPWMELIVVFDGFDRALEFADALAHAPGLVKKDVTFLAAPIPDHLTQMAPALPPGRHAVFVVLAESSHRGLLELAQRFCGTITHQKTTDEVRASGRTIVEFTWNHTTLHALKVDKNLTYIQSSFLPGQHVRQVKELERLLNGEVMMHLEFLRTREGMVTCSGLQLVRYTGDARLNEIMQIYRAHGVQINNPHAYVVEDGKQAQLNPDVIAMKARFDPQGLLNPGKLRGWEQRERAPEARAAPAATR
jgi:FAD/FMN-containing dehydrogenase